MSTDFDRPVDRRGTHSAKWDRYAGRDVLPMWVADADFQAPPAVLEALQRRVAHGVFGYTRKPAGLDEAVCAHLHERFGWQVDPQWLLWQPGVVPALNVCCRAFTRPGDDVIVPMPVYPPILKAPGHSGCRALHVPLRQAGHGWALDREALEAAVTPRSRLVLLCSPHNPVGRVFEREELEWLLDWALRHDLLICSDEIHAELVLEPGRRHTPIASLGQEAAGRTLTLMAPSKCFNVAGLGCSFAVVPDRALRERLAAAGEGFLPHVNLMAYEAALAAYRDGGDWLQALIAYLRGNRDRTLAALRALPGVWVGDVEASYLAWFRVAGVERPAPLFESGGVGLSDGADFGAPEFARLNFGCTRATLDAAFQRLAVTLQRGATERSA